MCYLLLVSPHHQRVVLGGFVSLSGRWRLLCKKLITAEECPHMIVPHNNILMQPYILVLLLVSVCCDTAQTLVFLPVSMCCDTAQSKADKCPRE